MPFEQDRPETDTGRSKRVALAGMSGYFAKLLQDTYTGETRNMVRRWRSRHDRRTQVFLEREPNLHAPGITNSYTLGVRTEPFIGLDGKAWQVGVPMELSELEFLRQQVLDLGIRIAVFSGEQPAGRIQRHIGSTLVWRSMEDRQQWSYKTLTHRILPTGEVVMDTTSVRLEPDDPLEQFNDSQAEPVLHQAISYLST